jgi:hypothetical protein
VERSGLIKAILEEEKPIETCCKCGKKAHLRSYGGETGDYCFDCHYEMLMRINGM